MKDLIIDTLPAKRTRQREKRLAGLPLMFYTTVAMRKGIERKANREGCSLSEAVRLCVQRVLEEEGFLDA